MLAYSVRNTILLGLISSIFAATMVGGWQVMALIVTFAVMGVLMELAVD